MGATVLFLLVYLWTQGQFLGNNCFSLFLVAYFEMTTNLETSDTLRIYVMSIEF